jgi:Ca-activated chloride channel family protein
MQITFTNPTYLFFLFSIPLLILTHFFTMIYLRRRAFKFANLEAIWRVTGGDKAYFKNTIFLTHNTLLLMLRISILVFLILAAAGTILWTQSSTNNYDVVLAIDASSSMLATDFEPTRLDAAKSEAINFVNRLSSRTRSGLVSFAGSSFVEQDLTSNPSDVVSAIEKLEVKSVGGTDIGGAIITASNVLMAAQTPGNEKERARIIVLMTDGRSNVGATIQDGVDYALKNNIRIFTIGVATPEGGTYLRTESISKLDEPSLQYVADSTQGKYFKAESAQNITSSFEQILTANTQNIPNNLSRVFLLLGVTLLFLEWGLISTRFRSVP